MNRPEALKKIVALSLTRADDQDTFVAQSGQHTVGEAIALYMAATELMAALIKLSDEAVRRGEATLDASVRAQLEAARDQLEQHEQEPPPPPPPTIVH